MPIRPDYGLYLERRGASGNVLHIFYSVPIDHLSLVKTDLFSTMVGKIVDGNEYAVSFDFGIEVFDQLVSLAPKEIQDEIIASVKSVAGLPRTINLSRPLSVQIEAILGEKQRGLHDEFIPFVVTRMLLRAGA